MFLPLYDPLKLMVREVHKRGMELHAWMNPLRIQMNDTPSVLSEDNPWNLWQGDEEKAGWVVQSGAGKYYNPAYPEVRAEIAACAEEIASRYDVDGIQFDDYFYPTQDAPLTKRLTRPIHRRFQGAESRSPLRIGG